MNFIYFGIIFSLSYIIFFSKSLSVNQILFKRNNNVAPTSVISVSTTYTLRTLIECASLCMTSPSCSAFTWSSLECTFVEAENLTGDVTNFAQEVYIDSSFQKVDGNWGGWTETCDRFCYHPNYWPTGNTTRTRSCLSPKYGGFKICQGSTSEVLANDCGNIACPTLTGITTKTGNGMWAGVLTGGLLVNVTNLYGTMCSTNSLDNTFSIDLSNGATDTFDSQSVLGPCYNFPLPTKFVRIRVIHFGSDQWEGDWVKITLSDGTVKMCLPDPQTIYPDMINSATFLINDNQYMLATCV